MDVETTNAEATVQDGNNASLLQRLIAKIKGRKIHSRAYYELLEFKRQLKESEKDRRDSRLSEFLFV